MDSLTVSMIHRVKIILLPLLLTVAYPILRSQDIAIPVPLQMELLVKILAFERNHCNPETTKTVVSIVFQGNFRKSLESKVEAYSALTTGSKEQITIKEIDLDRITLEEALNQQKPQVLLVCPLRSYPIETISLLSRKQRILSTTLVAEYVRKGLTIGIEVERDRPLILINMDAARLEQANFDSRLLSIARLIKP